MKNFNKNQCKICKSIDLVIVDHTAKCRSCGVLLYYPYPTQKKPPKVDFKLWYGQSFEKNIKNFTNIILYAADKSKVNKELRVLDYGGASGQFALIFKSLFPVSKVYLVDIVDESLFKEFRPMNKQIKFSNFEKDRTKFDLIFLNDVYEHVEDPIQLLSTLRKKLNPSGIIFVDTPKQFWIYPFFNTIFKPIYKKILKGTVSKSHLQIWSNKSFEKSVKLSKLKIKRIDFLSELTMDTDIYLKQMGLDFLLLKLFVRIISQPLIFTFKNKIYAVLEK